MSAPLAFTPRGVLLQVLSKLDGRLVANRNNARNPDPVAAGRSLIAARAYEVAISEVEAILAVVDSRTARLRQQRDALWQLLDDIDTLSDACRDDDKRFRELVYKLQRRRFEVWNPETER